MFKKSVVLFVGISVSFTSLSWAGESGTEAWSSFQNLMGDAAVDAATVLPEEPILLAKKKKRGKKGRGNKHPKPVKISAKSTRTISLQDQTNDRLSSLGTSDDRDPSRLAAQTDAKVNRLLGQQTREKRFLSAVQTRIFNGADINSKDSTGRTYLHAAVINGFPDAARFLVKNGADVSIKDATGMTPLDLAKSMQLKQLMAVLGEK
ncbi:MAG: ankyrin repeat domain-containing protein [Verrucomicrobiota bacterium]